MGIPVRILHPYKLSSASYHVGYFQAIRSSGFTSKNNYAKVSYDSETGTSLGTSSFNYGDGKFHCPASGTYKFDFRAVKDDDAFSSHVKLMKKTPGYNAAVMATSLAQSIREKAHIPISVSAILDLNKGDEVWVEANGMLYNFGKSTYFSGFQLP